MWRQNQLEWRYRFNWGADKNINGNGKYYRSGRVKMNFTMSVQLTCCQAHRRFSGTYQGGRNQWTKGVNSIDSLPGVLENQRRRWMGGADGFVASIWRRPFQGYQTYRRNERWQSQGVRVNSQQKLMVLVHLGHCQASPRVGGLKHVQVLSF